VERPSRAEKTRRCLLYYLVKKKGRIFSFSESSTETWGKPATPIRENRDYSPLEEMEDAVSKRGRGGKTDQKKTKNNRKDINIEISARGRNDLFDRKKSRVSAEEKKDLYAGK